MHGGIILCYYRSFGYYRSVRSWEVRSYFGDNLRILSCGNLLCRISIDLRKLSRWHFSSLDWFKLVHSV